ncbi:MAG: response regulator transcription factor [Anaerolineaceae bacterium]|nr:response regulator transcription factor [Anaerolineaceae bacterium]
MKMREGTIQILITDDHAMVRMGLKTFFATTPDIKVIGEASNGQEAIEQTKTLAPDVVLMDLLMPGMDGVEATRQIKSFSPSTEVIVLTSYHDDENIFPAIRAGALSYLLKDIDPDDLAEAIRRAYAHEAVLNPRVAARLMKELHGGKLLEATNPFSELTDRELEVLQQVAAGKSNLEIAETLFISEKTVKSHITNILSKLHLADRTQAAVLAWQSGVVRRTEN